MRFSATVLSTLGLAAGVFGASIPAGQSLNVRDTSVTVFSDTGSAVINVPSTVTPLGAGEASDRAGGIADIISKVIDLVSAFADDDIKHRQAFTQNTAAQVHQAVTPSNVIVCNVGYDFQGTILSRNSVKFKAKVGAAVSYDVITFDSGTFDRQGDGGFQNWAYVVRDTCTIDGGHIACP